MFKKFTLVCGLLLAVTTAMATPFPWVQLDDTPEQCPVGQGAHITYGADSIWGVFPNSDSDETYVAHYGPLSTSQQPPSGDWYVLDDPLPMGAYTYHTGLTFQWELGSALYVIGAGDYAEGDAYLYWYDSTWHDYDIDEDTEFVLGVGASIVYVPNSGYDAYNQVAGYIYCLPGNGSEFWRYGIEPGQADYISVLGIFPPSTSTIADQTPLFQWTGMSNLYRLQVSTEPSFSIGPFPIDDVVYAPEYQTASKLGNAMYYWRTGTPNGLDWTWSATHNFTLEGGFVQCSPIPDSVANGAALAYEADPWCWVDPSIIAFVGGGSTNFYKYDVLTNTWDDTLADTPKPQYAGTSLTTNDPMEEFGEWPGASFGGSDTSDRPWGYNVESNTWFEYPQEDFDAFPMTLGPGASSGGGLRPWSYQTFGSQGGTHTHYFYAIEPKKIKELLEGGSQSGDARVGNMQARVIASFDGVEVEYQLPAAAHVRATLHDATGRQVGALDAGEQQRGVHRLSWNRKSEGTRLSSGAYFVLVDVGEEQARLKAVIR